MLLSVILPAQPASYPVSLLVPELRCFRVIIRLALPALFLILRDVIDPMLRIVPVLLNADRARMLSLSLLLVASRAERYYLILPDLPYIGGHIPVIFLSVTGYD
jgi:hypothetical protein